MAVLISSIDIRKQQSYDLTKDVDVFSEKSEPVTYSRNCIPFLVLQCALTFVLTDGKAIFAFDSRQYEDIL